MSETPAASAGPPGSQTVVNFEHVPHPHIAARKVAGPAKTKDQRTKGKGPIGRLNARFGVFITVAVGTMWCAYVFTLLALVSLPAALQSHDKIIIVAWIAQTFLQLVLLPIIIVGRTCRPQRRISEPKTRTKTPRPSCMRPYRSRLTCKPRMRFCSAW